LNFELYDFIITDGFLHVGSSDVHGMFKS
jgi:hypothetical protein